MVELLTRILGRMPIGWLQLFHSKGRLAAALAGVAFANVLVFVQLGILGALNTNIVAGYSLFDADIMVSASDANTMTDGSNVPRQRMFQALAVPGIVDAMPLYIGVADWVQANGTTISFRVYGVDPLAGNFLSAKVGADVSHLQLLGTALLDQRTRGVSADFLGGFGPSNPLRFEMRNETLTVKGQFTLGSGFSEDGNLIVSDQTFLRLFDNRASGAPNHIFLKVQKGMNPQHVIERLKQVLPTDITRIRTVAEAASEDQVYQTTERPTGLIFGFGVVVGVLVGFVIVYQVLSTDVADHLKEYATFKAMGYEQRFFTSIVLEEAVILAVLGFIPGYIIAQTLYIGLASMTGLPVAMTLTRVIWVFAGTVIACAASGIFATRRLAAADPADLF